MIGDCLLEVLKACCCKCEYRDDAETCCSGMYVVKPHGYCQGFKKKEA